MKTRNKLQIGIACLLALLMFSMGFVTQVARAKLIYTEHIAKLVNQYLQQQHLLMQRLGNNLINPLQQRDVNEISRNIRVYEDVLYTLAKQNLTIPASLHLVSLNAPQLIIGSFGISDKSALAPDELYYVRAIEFPEQMAQSHLYSKLEMPDYFLLNLGVAILDAKHAYCAQLDLKLAVNALQDFIQFRLEQENLGRLSKIFTFKFTKAGLQTPEISIHYGLCRTLFILYFCLSALIGSVIILVSHALLKFRQKINQQQLDLEKTGNDLNRVNQQYMSMRLAAEVQNKYGKILSAGASGTALIDLKSLLYDIRAVNLELALEHGVQLVFPEFALNKIRFYAHQIRIMQILSGIIFEIIEHMRGPGSLELQVQINDNHHGQQGLVFSFIDNGFYDRIIDATYQSSRADIRCKGWQNICDLIALEQGVLEHVHTPYVGNVIKLALTSRVVSNVISLESYLQD